ncbi:sulfotransferase family 2 domain-containing protein [Pseudoxanthobacter sp. M-2]|uniref:sulfotransferase family 2 domain-containing protein n=1 Tax=Pseudoxanthobacter sp. M-2 TaxID=3078754 RepID=UPI0038FCEEB5
MILCHRHRFIFLKTWKTGSTSIELGLGGVCGPDDVITPVGHDEKLRVGPPPQNQNLPMKRWPLTAYALMAIGRSRAEAGVKFFNHMRGEQVKRMVPAAVWRDYVKISIERNPWDREVSHYFWRNRDPNTRPSFRDYVLNDDRKKINNWSIYTIDDKIVADVMLHTETLSEDYGKLSARLGVDLPALPSAKSNYRRDHRPYRELYDAETRAVIEKRYAREIEAFGYDF